MVIREIEIELANIDQSLTGASKTHPDNRSVPWWVWCNQLLDRRLELMQARERGLSR